MTLKHTNPTKSRYDRKARMEVTAVAPYNFISLPEKMVEAQPSLSHDRYYPKPMGITGWIECELETCSPTYIRGMLTEKQFAEFGQNGPDKLTDDQKTQMAAFFSVEKDVPLLPGSSLRGMIRQVMEIVGHGRMRYVSPKPTFTFRAVANLTDDPLRGPYKEIIGNNANRVKAGYLKRKGDKWFIVPAQTQKAIGWSTKSNDQYIKVYDEDISNEDLPGFLPIGHKKYIPQIHQVSFKYGDRKPKTNWNGKGNSTRPSIVIGTQHAKLGYVGTLVCAGDMLETTRNDNDPSSGKEQGATKNKHIIVLPPVGDKRKELSISEQAVEDYRNGLTPFQEELSAWGGKGWGCLKDKAPVFYVPEGNSVRYFGHSPNFRIPARLNVSGETRAANPRDFIPDQLRKNSNPDLVDAIFGWVEEKENGEVVGPKKQYAGRVFFTDARCLPNQENVWYKEEPITPHTLSGPKSTTFQHYLVQDSRAGQNGHHSNDKKALTHYGTPPDETHLRGYKLYWHKGKNPDLEASAAERKHPKQLTKIKPVRDGVQFRFKIHFENLRPEELGLLWWVLALPGDPDKQYRHKLGMGKPLGMGSITIIPKLFVSDRPERYQTLFSGEFWKEAIRSVEVDPYVEAMNRYLLQEQGLGARLQNITELERIKALLAMLEWREETPEWQAKTRYMEIERLTGRRNRRGEPETFNEYKERPVLPDPFGVIGVKMPAPAKKSASQSKPNKQPQPKPKLSTSPQIGERVMGKVVEIKEDGDVYLEPQKNNYRDWYLRLAKEYTEGIHYQTGQDRACLVVKLLPEDEIIECKPAPKKGKKK